VDLQAQKGTMSMVRFATVIRSLWSSVTIVPESSHKLSIMPEGQILLNLNP